METAAVAPARTRVAMVIPRRAVVTSFVADLRATPDEGSELVDQLHWKEFANVLREGRVWDYVQAEDHYFGWVRHSDVRVMAGRNTGSMLWVGVPLAAVHDAPDRASLVIGHLPAGTTLAPRDADEVRNGWVEIPRGHAMPNSDSARPAYVSLEDAVDPREIPQRPPTADDLIATAEAFLGTPYLWGGTSALGIDCSGYVQQVYRLNGVRLDRDADQQAMEGRPVEEARAGDLLFFGDPRITHVALATGEGGFLHAPQSGGFVERGSIAKRTPRVIRRYLPDPA